MKTRESRLLEYWFNNGDTNQYQGTWLDRHWTTAAAYRQGHAVIPTPQKELIRQRAKKERLDIDEENNVINTSLAKEA